VLRFVKAPNSADFPTLGRPTIPTLKFMIACPPRFAFASLSRRLEPAF
jgi:hypothetical protein